MQPIDDARVRARLYLTALAAHVAVALALPFSRVTIDYDSFVPGYAVLIVFIAADLAASRLGARRTMAALDVFIAGSLLITPTTIATYLAFSLDMPLADEKLAAWDAALGFDWRGFIGFVDARPVLASALDLAYRSFVIQLFLLPVVFAARGEGARAAAMVSAFAILCFASSAVAIWFPAFGSYVTYGVAQHDLANINAKYGFFFLEQFNAVRAGGDFVLSESRAAGILTFPSVHAGAAAICAWVAWGSRTLRYPFLALNVAMATAAISHANHYAVDVIAGVALAALSILAAKALYGLGAPAAAISPQPAPGFAGAR